MLKAIVLRIAAFLLIVAGGLALMLGCSCAPISLIGFFEILVCVAVFIACFFCAFHCCWEADDSERKTEMKTPKHPRHYYNVTVGTDNDPEIYTHMSKLNVTNIVKMALDVIEDDTSASLFVSIEHEPANVTKMLHSNNPGRKRYKR